MRRSDQQQSTAFERARIAYELMMQRKRAATAERRVRERSRRTTIVTVMVGMLCLLIGSSIYNGWYPSSWRSSARVEDDTFARTRTGQVRSFVKGDTCRDLQFSNDRGAYVSGSLVPCETIVSREPAPALSKTDRLNSIRDAFTAR